MDSKNRSSRLEIWNYKAGGPDKGRGERFLQGASGERKKYGQKSSPFQKTNTKGAARKISSGVGLLEGCGSAGGALDGEGQAVAG